MKQTQNGNDRSVTGRKARLERCREKTKQYGKEILHSEGFKQSKRYIQHGNISVHKHSLHVATMALMIAEALKVSANEEELVRGALLHDYFQYDWHDKPVTWKNILRFYEMHGFTHPQTALKNAKRDFQLTSKEQDIIKKHMWPLTIKPPACREAWIVTAADKYCSLKETLFLRGDKTKSAKRKSKKGTK